MGPTIVFRAAHARAWAVLSWAVTAVLLVAFYLNGGPAEVAQYGAVPLILAVLGWVAFWRPHVTVAPAGVTVANVFRTADVPWPALDTAETRWGLRLRTSAGPVGAWAVPAPGALTRQRPDESPGLDLTDTEGTGHLEATATARVVAQVLLVRRAAALTGGGVHGGDVERRTDVVAVAATVGVLVLAVLTGVLLS